MKTIFSLKTGTSKAVLGTVLVLGSCITQPVLAQDAPTEPLDVLDTNDSDDGGIIVTARRREERLIDVPIAVTSISGEQLEQRGALDITDVAQAVPNVTLEVSRGTNSTLSAFIRGVGQQDPVSGFEQGVGIYLDDVYLNRPQAAVLDIYDVERIEVLRGPQGTLYGRNTIGGAVKYVTRQLPQEFSLKARATYGTYNQMEGVVTVSAPVSDLIRVGGSVARLTRDGFGKNLTTGLDNYDKDVWAARASLEIGGYGEPGLIRITGDYTKDKSNPRGGTRLIAGLATGVPVLDNVYDTRGALNDPIQNIEAYGLAMNVSLELGSGLTLRSISAWRKDDTATPIDFDALPVVDLDVPGFYRNEQISQEFQLLYDNGGPLQGLFGFYYLDANADTIFDTRIYTTFSAVLPKLTGSTEARVDTKTYAVFGDFSFDFTEQLSLSLGGRYTWDERDADILKRNYIFGGSPNFINPGVPFGAPDTDFSGTAKFKKFTPRASLSFQPDKDHNFYVSYSKGFKGGGFDPRGAGANAPDLDGNGVKSDAEISDFLSFLPETVDSYEVGYKGSLMNGALYVAAAAFRMDYTDVQIPGSQACTIQGVPNFCGVITNAGKAQLQGLELETTARLGRDIFAGGDRLNLLGSVGYIDAQYKEYIANIANTPTEVSDFREVQNTPKWTGNVGLSYLTPVGAGDVAFTTALTYRSKTYQFEIPNPYIDQGGYVLWDATAIYTAPNGHWSIGIFGKNLLNKEYKTSGYTFMAADPKTGALVRDPNGKLVSALGSEGILTAFYGNPRQVFVTATVKF